MKFGEGYGVVMAGGNDDDKCASVSAATGARKLVNCRRCCTLAPGGLYDSTMLG